ncbi:MAG: hypothetical protein H7X80_08320, partial [bacterium]|nr:hypothetical protein [Candidatus Kapabacteria bacterium]
MIPDNIGVMRLVACVATLLCLVTPLRAFDTPGHDVIEAAAYKWMLTMPRGSFPELPNESGKSILDTLISCGLLHRPEGYNDPHTELGLRDRLPIVGSGDPDLIFQRQFSANGQQFHFMATPEDVYNSVDTEHEPRPEFPRDLLEKAYPRCIRFLSGLTAEVLWGDREEIANAERGVYSVLHSIVDSYSNAHASRTDDLRQIRYVKGWDVTGVIVNIVYPSGWRWMGPDAQHRFSEPDDADYLRTDTMIVDMHGNAIQPIELRDDPYSIPAECLTR